MSLRDFYSISPDPCFRGVRNKICKKGYLDTKKFFIQFWHRLRIPELPLFKQLLLLSKFLHLFRVLWIYPIFLILHQLLDTLHLLFQLFPVKSLFLSLVFIFLLFFLDLLLWLVFHYIL